MNLKFNINLSAGGEELAVTMDMDMEATTEPEASHGKGEVSFDIAGSSMSTEMEIYSVKEAKNLGIQQIKEELERKIENKENIVNKNINTYEHENSIDVYVTYEVLENIGTNEKIVF